MKSLHFALLVAVFVCMAFAAGCGGGGGGSSSKNTNNPTPTPTPTPVNNTMAVTVGQIYVDGISASVTVCVPGTTSCQTIPNILVDTGSTGLRIVNSLLTISLPKVSNGQLGNCVQYVDHSFNWGLVATADITLGGETAKSVPIQLIGSPAQGAPTFPSVPSGCSSNGTGKEEDDVATLNANGIIGVGPFLQDCGPGCAPGTTNNPGLYYNCSASPCTVTTVALASQLQNPVSMFPTDNNGDIIELPAIASATGQATATGTMIFGIGTQSNNGLGTAAIYEMDPTTLGFATTYNGVTYGASGANAGNFIDSGSNGLYFLNTATTALAVCPSPNQAFYCTAGNFTVQNQSTTGLKNASFSVNSATTLFATNNAAFNNLAGPNPNQFDFGLSFFFGRNIYTAFESPRTVPGAPAGTTYPFWAF